MSKIKIRIKDNLTPAENRNPHRNVLLGSDKEREFYENLGYEFVENYDGIFIRHFIDYSGISPEKKQKLIIPDELKSYYRFIHNENRQRISFLTGRTPFYKKKVYEISTTPYREIVVSADPNKHRFNNTFVFKNPELVTDIKYYDAIVEAETEDIEPSKDTLKNILENVDKFLDKPVSFVKYIAIGIGLWFGYTVYTDVRNSNAKSKKK